MRLKDLFESYDTMLLEAYKSSIETRAFIEQLFANYGMTYDNTKTLFDQDYPTPSAKSQIRKAVNNHIVSLWNDITNYLRELPFVDKTSIKRTTSNFTYQTQDVNEKSLTNHISFKLIDFPNANLQIRISDHYLKVKATKTGNAYIYFMNVLTALREGVKIQLQEFINGVHLTLKQNSPNYTGPEVQKKSITQRVKPSLYKFTPQSPKPVAYSPKETLNINKKLMNSRESYNELISPTEEGKKNGFFYDTSAPFRKQNFPNEEVEASYVKKLNYHERCLINDISFILHNLSIVNKNSIKFNNSVSSNSIGIKSSSKYITFKLKGHTTRGVIRISDHKVKTIPENILMISIPRTTYTSDKFKEYMSEFLNELKKMD